jgi:oxygen-independent coproporphyrinogen III oxidase
VEVLTGAGYRWYETANFCRDPGFAGGRDLRARHNLAYWRGRDYLGLGIGAVSTVDGVRWRTAPKLAGYVSALARGELPEREVEPLSRDVQDAERVLLGLRLDEPLLLPGLSGALDLEGLARMERAGLAERRGDGELLSLTPRGRFLGGAVTVELLGKVPA